MAARFFHEFEPSASGASSDASGTSQNLNVSVPQGNVLREYLDGRGINPYKVNILSNVLIRPRQNYNAEISQRPSQNYGAEISQYINNFQNNANQNLSLSFLEFLNNDNENLSLSLENFDNLQNIAEDRVDSLSNNMSGEITYEQFFENIPYASTSHSSIQSNSNELGESFSFSQSPIRRENDESPIPPEASFSFSQSPLQRENDESPAPPEASFSFSQSLNLEAVASQNQGENERPSTQPSSLNNDVWEDDDGFLNVLNEIDSYPSIDLFIKINKNKMSAQKKLMLNFIEKKRLAAVAIRSRKRTERNRLLALEKLNKKRGG